MASTVPSPVNRMMAAFAVDFRDGVDVNLGVGYVAEETIPHGLIQKALADVVENPDRFRAPFNYGGPGGAPYLVDSIRRFYGRTRFGGLTDQLLGDKKIIVGASGATSLLEAIGAVLPPGIVITSDPNYYIYSNLLDRHGFQVVAVPEDQDGIDMHQLERTINDLGRRRDQISFVYVVTVNNPTCSVLANHRRRQLVEIVSRLSRDLGRKVPLLVDTAYELLTHDPAVSSGRSLLLDDHLGIVYEIGTLSKILAPALRIGFLIGQGSAFTDALVQKICDVGFSAPLANQAIASYLLDHHAETQLACVNRGYRAKSKQMRRAIDEHLGPYLSDCRGGAAGFYYYLTFNQIETGEDTRFFRYLVRTTGDSAIDGPGRAKHRRVIYIPGQYCVHPQGDLVNVAKRQLRLSYGFESPVAIEHALQTMGKAAQWAMGGT